MDAIQWTTDNIGNISAALSAIVIACAAVATIFKKPGDEDPKWLQVAYKVTNFIAMNFGKAKNKDDA